MSTSIPAANPAPSRSRVLLARAMAMEKVVYAAIGRAIVRKPWKPPGAEGFPYHRQSIAVIVIFVALSAGEIVALDFVVRRWIWVRIPLLTVGVWGLAWAIGVLCAHYLRPHTVGPDGIQVRNGLDLDAAVAWDDMDTVGLRTRVFPPKTPHIIDDDDGRALVMHVNDRSNVEIVLHYPTVVNAPGLPPQGGQQAVERIYLWTDDPHGFLQAVRRFASAEEEAIVESSSPPVSMEADNAQRSQVSQHFPSPAIEIAGLTKRFGATTAVDGIEFTVAAGSVLGLLGPNGSGKTTTVRIMATLLQPDAGIVRIGGYDVVRDAAKVRQLVRLTGQYASVDKDLSGYQNLVLIGRLLGMSRRQAKHRATELIDEVGLADAAHKPVQHYSGGMRRRLDLVASIMGEAAVIILDEPTTGLDPAHRNDTWAMIRRLSEQGSTVLLTTQYLEEAERLADGIVIIDAGRVIASGSPDELKRRMGSHTLDIQLLDPNLLSEATSRVEHIIGAPPVAEQQQGRLSIPVTDTHTMPTVVRSLDDAGIQVGELSLRLPSLDDVFIALTGTRSHSDEPATEQA